MIQSTIFQFLGNIIAWLWSYSICFSDCLIEFRRVHCTQNGMFSEEDELCRLTLWFGANNLLSNVSFLWVFTFTLFAHFISRQIQLAIGSATLLCKSFPPLFFWYKLLLGWINFESWDKASGDRRNWYPELYTMHKWINFDFCPHLFEIMSYTVLFGF